MAKTPPGAPNAADLQIADRIAAAMDGRDISILALSEEAGIAYPTLRRSIKAGRSLTIHEIISIADALGVNPSELLPDALTGAVAA